MILRQVNMLPHPRPSGHPLIPTLSSPEHLPVRPIAAVAVSSDIAMLCPHPKTLTRESSHERTFSLCFAAALAGLMSTLSAGTVSQTATTQQTPAAELPIRLEPMFRLHRPVYAVHDPAGRMFFLEQPGRVRLYEDGTLVETLTSTSLQEDHAELRVRPAQHRVPSQVRGERPVLRRLHTPTRTSRLSLPSFTSIRRRSSWTLPPRACC